MACSLANGMIPVREVVIMPDTMNTDARRTAWTSV